MRSDGVELRWPGKYDAAGQRAPIPAPGQAIEAEVRYGPPSPTVGRLVVGDNLAAMDALDAEGARLDLIYVDPPFATGASFSRTVALGEGEGEVRAPAFDDRWEGGVGGYLAMLDPRLRLCRRLLADHGSLYVHVDPTVGHAVKLLLDEIFGPECFQREIVWRIGWLSGFKTRARNWIRNHDTILFYTRDPARFTFNKQLVPYPPGYRRRDGSPPRGAGVPLEDVWNAGPADLALRGRDSLDSIQIKSFSREKTGWATQKNESLLRRIVEASSSPGDLVGDFFCGSGTTLAVAAALGRRFIGCDRSAAAVHLATERLRAAGVAFELASLGPRRAAAGEPREVSLGACGEGAAGGAEGPARGSLVSGTDSGDPERAGGEGRGGGASIDLVWRAAGPWRVEVELVGLAPGEVPAAPGEVAAALAERAAAGGLAFVDAWEIGDADPRPFTPLVERRRAAPRRVLEPRVAVELAPVARAALAVVVIDLLGRRTVRRVDLAFDADGGLAAQPGG